MRLLYIGLGTMFGFILSRSGAADYNYIQSMFLFERFQLYGIIGTAVVLTAPGLWMIKRFGRTAAGAPLQVELKPPHRGNILGGLLFGIGWSIAGMIFYKGSMFPQWKGSALISGIATQTLSRVTFDGKGGATPAERWNIAFEGKRVRVRDVEEAADGSLWLLEDANPGGLYHVTAK